MPYAIIIILILLCIYAPGLWTKHILQKYNKDEYFSGTGYDIACILLSDYGLPEIKVEETVMGDHYDPIDKVIRLNTDTCRKKTLTAVVTAAHEVGHAVQDAIEYPPLKIRTGFVGFAHTAEKIGMGLIIVVPFVTMLTRLPAAGILTFTGGFAALGIPVIVHLITLPVEFDASFNKAMTFLKTGKYIPVEQLPAARRILLACALTYVAAALAGILNIWRWLRILRR